MSEFQQSDLPPVGDPIRFHLRKSVVVVGMMGAGKTAVGRALALRLGVPFLDSDHEIETAANLSIPEIFARDGEPFFRKKEAQVITRLLDGAPCILSTGGGAFLSEANRAAISAKGVSVLLDADEDLLWSRVRHKNTRPLLQTDDPRATLAELYARRAPVYALADLSVPAHADYAIEDMVEQVVLTLLGRTDVLEKHDAS